MRPLFVCAALVLTAASSLPGAYAAPPERCDGCKAELSEADDLASRVPGWMEQSRQRAGPDAWVTRTGHFSWEVGSPRMIAQCRVSQRRWRCDRPLSSAFSQQL